MNTKQENKTTQELPMLHPDFPTQLSEKEIASLQKDIKEKALSTDTIILAHNYQLPEVQEIADFVGDSLELSRKAAETNARQILFCGVHFMAETAKILSPEKRVLLPDLKAGCSLADSITADQLREWKSKYPNSKVVMYVNTSAEVKAETDYCCTSSNAKKVVEHVWETHGKETEILFGPDMWLGSFIARALRLQDNPEQYKKFHVWDGECHVHAGIRPEDINHKLAEHPSADFLIHPECGCSSQALEFVASGDIDTDSVSMLCTSGMIQAVKDNPEGEFIIATETGMLHPLQKAAPKARLFEANRMAFCKYMKMITLPKMLNALNSSAENSKFEINVEKEIAKKAEKPIERMVQIG